MEPQGRGATRTTKVRETEFKGIQHKETNCTVDFSKRMEDHWDRGIESRRRERVPDPQTRRVQDTDQSESQVRTR